MWLSVVMSSQSFQDAIGQCLMVGIPQPTLDAETRRMLADLQPGGIILFQRNYTDPDTLQALCADIHALTLEHPPLIALDAEGGRVHRLSPPFTHFPPALRIGQTGSLQLAHAVGVALGQELRSVGIDIDFAPVLDVYSNPDNTVIGDRAFGSDPQRVAEFGCALAAGLRAAGVLPCGKHFPGHGATVIDSHDDLPYDERDRATLEAVDLLPFQAAIAQEIELLMTAHVVYPALDPQQPASLSPIIMNDLLRQRLGFQGVIVSDDLEMGAIVRHASVADAAVQALSAGADLLLVCQSLEHALSARKACRQALQQGVLTEERVAEAQRRVERLRQCIADRPSLSLPAIGAPEHTRLVDTIVRQASV